MGRVGLGIKINIGMLQSQSTCVYKSDFFLYNLNIIYSFLLKHLVPIGLLYKS